MLSNCLLLRIAVSGLILTALFGCNAQKQDTPAKQIDAEKNELNQNPDLTDKQSAALSPMNSEWINKLLALAEGTVEVINDDFSWATSTIELALAKDAISQSEEAWELMDASISRIEDIADTKERSNALSELTLALSYLDANSRFQELAPQIKTLVSSIEDPNKQIDIMGKLYSALAVHDKPDSAYSLALDMTTENPTQESYKLRTIREISVEMANQSNFDSAIKALNSLEGSFTYYQAVARTDIVTRLIQINAQPDKEELISSLLNEAVLIGRAQENGYFRAGALRDVAQEYIHLGNIEQANQFIEEARKAARQAQKPNERARAMSRIATKLADVNQLEPGAGIISEAFQLAEQIESETMRHYSLYEIAGSAAFVGDFLSAEAIIKEIPDSPFGSASSLKDAAKRDLAWGLAKHENIELAINTALSITSLRERTQALSRIVRLLENPDMSALPRYL